MDDVINYFITSLGGLDFLSLTFGLLIVISIIMALIRPLDF